MLPFRQLLDGQGQRILEEEITELLGREKSEHIEGMDAPGGYGNAYVKPRK